jgi:hypothetical protein
MITVDRGHVASPPPQLLGQNALATSNIQRSLTSRRNGSVNQRVILDVVVPPPPSCRHIV